MFAAHLAAGLALRTSHHSPPAAALLVGAFLPDLVWIALSGAGIDAISPGTGSDAWSHSVASILVLAILYAALVPAVERKGRLLLFAAVLSHLPLDAAIHPQPIELFPNSSLRAGWDLWSWGRQPLVLGFTTYFALQAALVVLLMSIYATHAMAVGISRRQIAASIFAIAFFQLVA
jgi:hypothetical protein